MSFGTWRFKSSHPHSDAEQPGEAPLPQRGGSVAVLLFGGSGLAARPVPTTEVIVTLDAPSLLGGGAIARPRHAPAPRPANIAAAQAKAKAELLAAIPSAQIVERYRIVADGFALSFRPATSPALPRSQGSRRSGRTSSTTRSRRREPPSRGRRRSARGPQVIGADKLWGADLETAGQGIKIGVIDDGIDAKHSVLRPGLASPIRPGSPRESRPTRRRR